MELHNQQPDGVPVGAVCRVRIFNTHHETYESRTILARVVAPPERDTGPSIDGNSGKAKSDHHGYNIYAQDLIVLESPFAGVHVGMRIRARISDLVSVQLPNKIWGV